jgi:tetratricopeptide (TPR) repeat protein
VHVDVSENWLETRVSPGDAHYRFANDSRGIAQLINLCRQRGVGKINMKATGEHGARARHALTVAGLSVTAANPLRARIFGDAGRARNARRVAAISLVSATIALGLAGLSAWQWGRAEQTLASASETTKGWMSDATQKFKNAPGAIASFLADVAGPVVGSNPGDKAEQRDLMLGRGRPADIGLTAGDRAAVSQSGADSLAIIKALSAVSPGDGGRRGDLSVAREKPGEAQRAQADRAAWLQSFRDSVAASTALSAANPGDAGRRRDLAVAYERLGDAQLAQGDLEAAPRSYGDSFALIEALSAAAPGDAGLRRDLAVAHEKLGDVQLARGELEAAARSYRDGFEIIKALSAADPGDAGRRRDIIAICLKLSLAEPANARDYLLKAQAIVKEVTDSGRSASSDRAWAAEIERRLKGSGAAALVGSPGEQKR